MLEGVDELLAHSSCVEVVVPGHARLPQLGRLLLENKTLGLKTKESLKSHEVQIPTCSDPSLLPNPLSYIYIHACMNTHTPQQNREGPGLGRPENLPQPLLPT